MADNETSKIMWVAIVVALAAIIYGVASGYLPKLAEDVFKTVQNVINGIKFEPKTPATLGFISGFFG